MLDTARKAQVHGVEVYAGLIVHAGNVGDLVEIRASVERTVPGLRVGAFLPAWQGRAQNLPRLPEVDRTHLPLGLQRRTISEREAVIRILGTPDLAARPVDTPRCEALVLDVYDDLSVYVGGACDTAGILGAAPELRERLRLGSLAQDGLLPLIERYRAEPPEPVLRLSGMTWGDLAQRYGEQDSDSLFDLEDLVLSKWAVQYLRATDRTR